MHTHRQTERGRENQREGYREGERKIERVTETYLLFDIPSGCCSFTGPWTVTRSSLRMLRRVATFCQPLRPVLLLVLFPRSWSPVVGVLGVLLPPPPLVQATVNG